MPFDFINPFRDRVASRSAIKVLRAVSADAIGNDKLQPNEFYFDIRLCELYLRKDKEAGNEFVPRALSITECLYGNDEELTLPVAVGEKLFAQLGKQADLGAGEKAITFRDCLLAGPLPYRGGDIGFFAGLYRVESGNFADSVLSLVGDIGGSLGLELSKFLDIGRQLTSRLPALLAVDSGDWRFGYYRPLYQETESFFDRYLVLLGAGDVEADLDSLEVFEQDSGATLVDRSNGKRKAFTKRDYLLVKLGSRETRGDYSRFEFHKRYTEIKQYLADRQLEKAEWAKIAQIQEIAECPDLTELHQHALIAMYRAKIDKWVSSLSWTRGGSAGNAGAKQLQDDLGSGEAIGAAQRAELPQGTVDTLANYAREWEGFQHLLGDEDEEQFSDATADSFLRVFRDKNLARVPAINVAEAVRIHRLSSHQGAS